MSTRPEETVPDRIEKEILLRAPRARVWRALTDAKEFGEWFGVELEDAFVPGARVRGRITIQGYDGLPMDLWVERIEPETLFSYRWVPYAVERGVDYANETTTLVEFRLKDEAGGTRLTVTESGFDRVPAARRAKAFRMNEGGWAGQVRNIERYLSASGTSRDVAS
jgi:uncharacterized protein YndB with AHSA1/START domain